MAPSLHVYDDASEPMVNITLDDTSQFIDYSDGWGVQPADDPDLAYYFQETYHGTQTVAANATIVFSGTAVYIFGSTGPNHGNFEVEVDGSFQTLSAYSSSELFQQCLYSAPLDDGYHTIVLINIGGTGAEQGGYLDLDYIVTTIPENATFPSQPEMGPITPSGGWGTPSSTSSPSTASSSPSSSPSSTTTVTTALTIVFALLTLLLALALLLVYLRKRQYAKAFAEQQFRYGAARPPSAGPPSTPPVIVDLHWNAHTSSPSRPLPPAIDVRRASQPPGYGSAGGGAYGAYGEGTPSPRSPMQLLPRESYDMPPQGRKGGEQGKGREGSPLRGSGKAPPQRPPRDERRTFLEV